ncbi:MAG: TIM-barrel domain-containing protein [Candidatus Acidiferrales bacterium]
MTERLNRRDVLKAMAAASTLVIASPALGAISAGEALPADALEVRVTSISPFTFRLSVQPVGADGVLRTIPSDGTLARPSWAGPVFRSRGGAELSVPAGNRRVKVAFDPLRVAVTDEHGDPIQEFTLDQQGGVLTFLAGTSPVFGLGEGGPPFDRRGSAYSMKSGQGGYKLETHGATVPIPWLIGTSGWAIFFHQPHGTFDLSGSTGKFQPVEGLTLLPLDLFVVCSRDPATILREYARMTGLPELPPLWSLGYQQSHRTLASREEVLEEAKTFREKKLPCDTMIYLSTGFCPSGWNTANGSFVWNSSVFPDPEKMIEELHNDNFRAVIHTVILSDRLTGTVDEPCDLARFDEEKASCYWDAHRRDFAMGVDGWWPDEGDPLDIASRLNRNRMYWEGPQRDRPNERPFALHRNGYAGMQRYGSFLWSGDVFCTWETLKTQVPVGIQTGLSGVPYWGTDIGGFVPTHEFSAEMFVRWFQFGAFCPLFRSHGRAWKLRLPWGWNTGDPGPIEMNDRSTVPDANQLHDARVEPICRKYLELRYRMLPYLYSAVRECTTTGMPIMRALWTEFPDDPKAVACGDEYMWGPSVLVAAVVEKGATERRLYLPRGDWYDFWTGEPVEGGRELVRGVDLETMPLYVRGGSILPLGPVKQYVNEKVDEPLSVHIYPGADASFLLYEDDGASFDYRKGEWTGIEMSWRDASKTLRMNLAPSSKLLSPEPKQLVILLKGEKRSAAFAGKAVEVSFSNSNQNGEPSGARL